MQVEFRATLWLHSDGGWYFVTLPPDLGADIAEVTAGVRRGFGSVRVEATVGGQTWSTSIFPDSASASFVLPVKKAIRQAAGVGDGDEVDVALSIKGV